VRHEVQDRLEQFFPECSASRSVIEFSRIKARKLSELYEFQIRLNGERRFILVKVRKNRGGGNLSGALDPDAFASTAMEYAALEAMHCHFSRLRDSRFLTVRPLGLVGEGRGLAMEKLDAVELRNWECRGGMKRGRRPMERLEKVFEAAGGWLREWHGLGTLPHSLRARIDRREFIGH
jgi:hypothetical protein